MLKPLADASDRALAGTALVRIDVNAADGWRLEAVLPTITHLAARARKVVLISHKGRPVPGKPLGKLSLKDDAQRLADLIDADVWFLSDTSLPAARKEIARIPDGSVIVLENIRAFKGEATGAASFATALAALGDYYVSDAFPVLHHAAASVTELPRLLPSYAGFRLVEELDRLDRLSNRVKRPYVVVIGGAKAQDKLGVLAAVIDKADRILVGGACANALLALSGVDVGASAYERDPKLLAALKPYVGHRKISLPTDFVRSGGRILDIGPKTAKAFAREAGKAGTVLWTGPLGLIEQARFAKGSLAVAKAIARNKKAFSVTGGGETVTFLKKHKLDRGFSFISTGGGALISYVAGNRLPGLDALAGKKAVAKATHKANAHDIGAALAPQLPKLAPVYDIFFHNDFDGYASAAIFTDFLKQRKAKVGRLVATEYGRYFDDLWNRKDGLAQYAEQKRINPAILVDFRYHPQAAFWYDHHETAFSREDWQRAFQPDAFRMLDIEYASGAHLAFDMLVQHHGYQPSPRMRELVRWADVVDGARYANPYQTIALREPALRIEASIGTLQRAATPEGQLRPEALPWLVELLATKPLDAVAKDRRIVAVVEDIIAQNKETLSYYRKHTAQQGIVAVTDMTGYDGRLLRFAPFYLVPNAVYGIVLSVKESGDIIGQVGVNPWKRERNAFNIGGIMTKHNGGGHRQVGVMRYGTREEIDRVVEHLVTLFNGSTS